MTGGRGMDRMRGWGGPGRASLRGRLPVLFLLLSLAVAGFGALEAYRAQRSHEATTVAVLEDYGSFAAWSYQQRAWQLLSTALDANLSIARTNVVFTGGDASEECLEQLLVVVGACGCAQAVTGRFAFFTSLGDSELASRWVGASPGPEPRARIVRAVRAHARDDYVERWPHAIAFVGEGPAAPVIAYTRVVSPRDRRTPDAPRDTLVYGLEVDRKKLWALFEQALQDEALLPPALTQERPNDQVIAVEVYGPGDDLLHASRPDVELAFAAATPRTEMFGGGVIRASVLPDVADELIIGGLPESRTPVLLLVVAIAGALAVLALVQLRREDQLAALRQDFVASVSHELRTPLAQVRLFTETLRLGRTRDERERGWALENIDRETMRLTNLVQNILHFSRAERGLRTGELEPADLAVETAGALTSFRQLVPGRRATFESDLAEPLPAMLSPDSIRQVVFNLLDNAARYGPAGQVVRVSGSVTHDVVRIAVEDEGPGVPASERERIFEPFHRGAGAVGTVVVGSGIGLSVVREIVSAHGGAVRVEDVPAGGARFVVELPRLRTARARHFVPADSQTRMDEVGAEVA